MNDLTRVIGFGLATGSALAYAYVVIMNWRVLLQGVRRPAERRPSLVFLAGPVMLVLLVQGLRLVAPVSGATVLTLLGVGLILDPAALPVVVILVWRRVRR